MLYTINEANNSVIFELPLYDYLGKGYRYNHEMKKRDSYPLNSLQDYEENFFDNFQNDYFGYITDDQVNDCLPEATAYLTAKGYTQAEIDLFSDDLSHAIKTALSDAWLSSYEAEWLKKFYKLTQKKIEQDLADALPNTPYNLLDSIDDKEFQCKQTDQQFLRLEIKQSDIITWLGDHNLSEYTADKDFIDYFIDNALDYDRSPINTEYIDPYGTLGDTDDWLECFNDSQEVSDKIDSYRQEEQSKLNNYELASANLKESFDLIKTYVKNYLPEQPKQDKIKRQIKALESIIKN